MYSLASLGSPFWNIYFLLIDLKRVRGQGVNRRVHLAEQKDLLIVVQDCKTYFWRGNIFLFKSFGGAKRERKGGELKEICCQFVQKWKSVFLFDAFQGKLPLLWTNPLFGDFLTEKLKCCYHHHFFAFYPPFPRKSFQQSYLHKGAFKSRVEKWGHC